MLKLKQLVLKNVRTVCGERYMVDILKINDETDCGGLLGVTDINDPVLDEYRDWLNLHIRMMEKMSARKFILTIDENVEL